MSLPVPLRRLGYRVAYAGLRVYWLVFRPRLTGVKCVLTFGEEVLLVRHTYGHSEWDLPGGATKRGEAPELTARREMREELGIDIPTWQSLGRLRSREYHRRDTLHFLHAELASPAVEIDLGELRDAGWFRRQSLPSDLSRYARRILALLPD